MIEAFDFTNFGPLEAIRATSLGKINLVIGDNSCGKTYLLKALYAIIRSSEEFGRGDDNRDFSEVLSDKLYWTFQAGKIGDLVTKGSGKRLKAALSMFDNGELSFEFGQDTSKQVRPNHNTVATRPDNSVFIPPKEVLSLAKVIAKSALQDRAFGYDATYVDLVLALQNPQRNTDNNGFGSSRKKLENMFSGRIEFNTHDDNWEYRRGNARFSIHSTAEGIKKTAILDILLGNGYLTNQSVIFIDEPESALHPTAISELLNIIDLLAKQGIQFFIASHSYFVIKKLLLIALKNNQPIPCLMPSNGKWQQSCLLEDGLPDTEIINESIRIYEQELMVGF